MEINLPLVFKLAQNPWKKKEVMIQKQVKESDAN